MCFYDKCNLLTLPLHEQSFVGPTCTWCGDGLCQISDSKYLKGTSGYSHCKPATLQHRGTIGPLHR